MWCQGADPHQLAEFENAYDLVDGIITFQLLFKEEFSELALFLIARTKSLGVVPETPQPDIPVSEGVFCGEESGSIYH